MDNVVTRLFGVFFIALFVSCSAPADTGAGGVSSLDGDFDRRTLIIEADDRERHQLNVYIAADFDQQRRGLMFVRKMPDDTGMLFIYEDSGMHSMWMKNTYIPLDLIFARADGTVSSVIHDTQPLSLQSRASIEPVTYVLELNAGAARRLHIGNKSRLIIETDSRN